MRRAGWKARRRGKGPDLDGQAVLETLRRDKAPAVVSIISSFMQSLFPAIFSCWSFSSDKTPGGAASLAVPGWPSTAIFFAFTTLTPVQTVQQPCLSSTRRAQEPSLSAAPSTHKHSVAARTVAAAW